ncbi:hypothetical protein, partial [Salmonella sp. SAL4436]|uniref:hypothetical protein n=1 Tax=Salmonella sp. SAL4436 TaxID=3159891 RepID=UPI003978E25B
LYHSTFMMRKVALEAVGGYRVPFEDAEDRDLLLRMSERYELANLKDPVGCYRISEGQCGQQNVRRQSLRSMAAVASAQLRRASGT